MEGRWTMREDEGERRRWHARAKERGSETKRDAIDSGRVEFFFFFSSSSVVFFTFSIRENIFFSLSQKAHSPFSPPSRAGCVPLALERQGARVLASKKAQRGEKKRHSKRSFLFFPVFRILPSPPSTDAAPRRRQRCPAAARIEAASRRRCISRAAERARPRGKQQQQQ